MISVQKRGRVTIVTIDRPEKHNALDATAQQAMGDAFEQFEADSEQWVAVLTGAGDKAFCAGHDLATPPPEGPEGLPSGGFGGITARFGMAKPVIAAVNGLAVGGGFEMALAADIVVCAPHARFAMPEVTVGMTALAGGILRLTRLAGHQSAMAALLTGRMLDAGEAKAMGVVSEIAADRPVLDCAMAWADRILQAGPLAVQATKAVALQCAAMPIEQAMEAQWHLPEVRRAQNSQDASEGPLAFTQRRKPRWQGR